MKFQFRSLLTKKSILGVITAAAVIVLVIGLYRLIQGRPKKYTGPIEDVIIAASRLEATTLVRIALRNGYFEEYGLNVTMTEQSLGKFSLQEVFDGKADIATVAEMPVMKNSFKRDDIRVLATIHTSSTNVKIIARKDHGINAAGDLKGKRVGTTVGTVGEFFLFSFLLHAGLGAEDIKLVDKDPSGLSEALRAGEIDAFSLREPHVFRAQEELGNKAITLPLSGAYTATFNVVSLSDFIERKPHLVKRLLQALLQAEEFVKNNREETIDIISQDLQLDRGYLDGTWEESKFTLALDQSLILTMEDEARWAIKNNLTSAKKVPNYLDLVYLDALEAVKPEAVTIIR
jgi:ABC-type nitrate/sulfonate/bicarbonate transport system substrate-binding protein